MNLRRRTFLGGAAAITAAPALASKGGNLGTLSWPSGERFALWPRIPPGAPKVLPTLAFHPSKDPNEIRIKGIAVPEVNVFRAPRPDGSAILSIPGGSYKFLVMTEGGLDPARRFTPEGTSVFVLSYRLPDEGWANRSTVALADAQRAMRLIRYRARDFAIDPDRLGVLGFSAGGHLATDLAVSFDDSVYRPVDAADRLSARPAYLGLLYPITTMGPFTYIKARDNLLGADASPDEIRRRSPDLHVNAKTPPSFLAHAMDDSAVPVDNSLTWIAAARAAGVPVEAYLPQRGGHGFGFSPPPSEPVAMWPELFVKWMRRNGG